MAELISIKSRLPHLSGKTVCLVCGDKGIAIAPIGDVFMKCDKCGTQKKVFKFSCERDSEHWICNCGNNLFMITPDGIYCPNCGIWQEL